MQHDSYVLKGSTLSQRV